jgi:hypothetical protein
VVTREEKGREGGQRNGARRSGGGPGAGKGVGVGTVEAVVTSPPLKRMVSPNQDHYGVPLPK